MLVSCWLLVVSLVTFSCGDYSKEEIRNYRSVETTLLCNGNFPTSIVDTTYNIICCNKYHQKCSLWDPPGSCNYHPAGNIDTSRTLKQYRLHDIIMYNVLRQVLRVNKVLFKRWWWRRSFNTCVLKCIPYQKHQAMIQWGCRHIKKFPAYRR